MAADIVTHQQAEHMRAATDGPITGLATRQEGALGARASTMARSFEGLIPASLGEAVDLAGRLARSKVIPKALQGDPESTFAVIMAGMELGLTPIRAVNSISIISGNMTMKADLQLALVRKSGILADYNEGYAVKGEDAHVPDEARALVAGMAAGRCYGWAMAQRKGDARAHWRVFTQDDADRAEVTEWENGSKKTIKLSQKNTYRNYPQDMYPRRAKGRLFQAIASDILSGLPPAEAYDDGQVLDVSVLQAEHARVLPASAPMDVDSLLARIRDAHGADVADAIARGFDAMDFAKGKRLAKLNEYRDRPEDLREWLRTEYVQRQGRERAAKTPAATESADTTESTKPTSKKANGTKAATTPAPTDAKTDADDAEDDRALQKLHSEIFGQRPRPEDGASF